MRYDIGIFVIYVSIIDRPLNVFLHVITMIQVEWAIFPGTDYIQI